MRPRRWTASSQLLVLQQRPGFSTEASAIEAANLSVSGYLLKPFKMSKVLLLAAGALGQ